MNLPTKESLNKFYKQTTERQELDNDLLAKNIDNYKAIARVLRPGDRPVKVFRVDMDALDQFNS